MKNQNKIVLLTIAQSQVVKVLTNGRRIVPPHLKDERTDTARNHLHTFSHCSMRCLNGTGNKVSATS